MQEEALQGNENIEQAIAALQQNATPELLAHALTAIRRRIRENGQFVVAVEPNPGTTQMSLKVVQTPDLYGGHWQIVGNRPDRARDRGHHPEPLAPHPDAG